MATGQTARLVTEKTEKSEEWKVWNPVSRRINTKSHRSLEDFIVLCLQCTVHTIARKPMITGKNLQMTGFWI